MEELPAKREEWLGKDYVGTITWRAKQKMYLPDFEAEIVRAKAQNADVIVFMKPSCPQQQDLLGWAQKCYPHFAYLWCILCKQLGYKSAEYKNKTIPVFYDNYWMTTPTLMDKYIAHILKAKEILETFDTDDGEFKKRLNSDTGHLYKTPHVGLPTATYHSFLLERLSCLFFWAQGAKIYAST